MANVTFSKLGLTKNTEVVEVIINEQTIEVKQFLPTFDKVNLVASAVKSAIVDGVVNEMILEVGLHYLIIQHYTNIKFSDKQIENMIDTFDLLESNDVIDRILEAIPEEDYDHLFDAAKVQSAKVDEFIRASLHGYAGQVESTKSLEDMFKTSPALEKIKQ